MSGESTVSGKSTVMAIHRSGVVTDAEGTEYPIRPMSILEVEGRALRDFMVQRGYSQSLETGMAYGVSTLWLADAAARVEGGHHIAIDPRQHSGYHSIGMLNVERAGLNNVVDTYVESSELRLPKLVEAKTKLDFAFIDGRHLFDSALIDFFYVDRMLDEGGIVMFDDANWPAITKLIRYVMKYPCYEYFAGGDVNLVRSVGRDVLRGCFPRLMPSIVALRKVARDDRSWDWYAHF